ncbi:MAG: transketolase C-terminal domain-containing protein, partial [Bacillota bacterium]|nr:transketolase C-terminal domain-containing protein [Bacillota bacterium]
AMLSAALAMDGPVAVRYPRSQGWGQAALRPASPIEHGRGVLVRDGDDVAIVAIGSMVHPSLQAAVLLERKGIRAAVVNARFAKPLDEDLLFEVAGRCGRVVVVEEGTSVGGFGSAVAETLSRRVRGGHAIALRHLALPDAFVQHGSREALLAACGLTPSHIARAAVDLCEAGTDATRKRRSSPPRERNELAAGAEVTGWQAQTMLLKE